MECTKNRLDWNDTNKIRVKWDILISSVFLLIALIMVVLAIKGNYELSKKVEKCTQTVYVSCSEKFTDDWLVAPAYGGRVYTKYSHSYYYTWSVGEEDYTVKLFMTSMNQNEKVPEFITVRYDPADPDSYVVERSDEMESLSQYVSIITDRATGVVEPKKN